MADWKQATSKDELLAYLIKEYHQDFKTVDWDGPGDYYIYTDAKRCPRGCCWDSYAIAISASARAHKVTQEMKELADELREARSHIQKEI